MKRLFGWKCLSSFAPLLFGLQISNALAAEESLMFSISGPATMHLNVRMLDPWSARVNEQGTGVVKLDVRRGSTLANQSNWYDRLVNDVFQMTYGSLAYVSGKFVRTLVVTLPYVTDNGEEGSVAFWRLYKSGLLDSEFDETVPLLLCVFPQSGLHMTKPLKSFDGLGGAKIGAINASTAEVTKLLGGTPVTILMQDFYPSLQRGLIEGMITPWTAFQPYKLAEVTSYHIDTKLGGGTGSVVMARKRYNALPEAARKVLDANSGEAYSRQLGAFWDSVRDEGRQEVEAKGGKHTVVDLTPQQAAKWRQMTDPVTQEWVKDTRDGAKILAALSEISAKVKTEK